MLYSIYNFVRFFKGLGKMLNMQEAGAIFACMRCELEGYKDLAIDRMRYGLYLPFLPSGHPQRPRGCQHRPNQRTHNSIMRNAEQAEQAGNPVKEYNMRSLCVLSPSTVTLSILLINKVQSWRLHWCLWRYISMLYGMLCGMLLSVLGCIR